MACRQCAHWDGPEDCAKVWFIKDQCVPKLKLHQIVLKRLHVSVHFSATLYREICLPLQVVVSIVGKHLGQLGALSCHLVVAEVDESRWLSSDPTKCLADLCSREIVTHQAYAGEIA